MTDVEHRLPAGERLERDYSLEADLVDQVLAERQREERRQGRKTVALRILVVVGFLALWEFAAGRLVDDFFTSSPLAIIEALWRSITERRLLWHAQITIVEAVTGYLLGCLVGVVCALFVAKFERLYEVVEPLVLAVYGIPRIALAPLFITWLGIGITSKILIAAFMVFFIVFMNTIAGFHSANPKLIQISRMMGAGRNQILWKILLPTALPYIMTALRIVVPTAMIGAIVGEFISAQRGLGFFISRATFSFDIAGAFAAIFVLMVIVVAMNGLVNFADRRLMRWRTDGDAGPAA
jgi:NitT/TauT family transport system permease protein